MWYILLQINWKQFITTHGISISILLIIILLLPAGYIYAFKIQNINLVQPTLHILCPRMTSQTHKIFIIEDHLIYNVHTARSWYFAILLLQLWWVVQYEMMDGWIILSLVVILHILGEGILAMYPIGSSFLKKLDSKVKT